MFLVTVLYYRPISRHIGIQGSYGDYVDSIRFVTNGRIIPDLGQPAFGGPGGSRDYRYSLDEGHIVGFFGNTGDWIDSIGIITQLSP